MKNILIFLLLILVSCSRTSHLTLYSNQEFDRKHFTIDTLKKGDQIFGEYGTKAFLFFSDNYDLDAKNGLQLNLNHTADNAFKYSKSKILVDVDIEETGLTLLVGLPIVDFAHQTITGYESNHK
ncbi:MAG: hypothetical protein SPJ04_00120 [Bdellovibrionota bacterium]|nr:hypothetical protein [Bdellovibrionota bacterium]